MFSLAIAPAFIPHWPDLKPFSAELWLIATIVAVLLTPFFTRRSNLPCALVTLAGLSVALISVLAVGSAADVTGEHLRGLLLADGFAALWKVLLLLFTIGVTLMGLSTTFFTLREGDGPEFYTLLLGATLGMALMGSTDNLLMIFLAIEMASLPSYVLAGFRKTHRVGAEASLKYVLFGAACSAVMLYGFSNFYALYGTVQIGGPDGIAQRIAQSNGSDGAMLVIGFLGLLVGAGFKIAAAPLHFWCPDVFEGASIDVSNFLSVASKGAGLVLLLRVLMTIADALGYQSTPHFSLMSIALAVGIVGAITATIGNTGAFSQTNIKRLLAYSSIAHAGYMLCAVSLLVSPTGASLNRQTVNTPAQVLLIYLAVYLCMNLGAFTVAGLIWRQTGSENLADYSGLARRAPILAVCMFCFLISLVGLPPFAGFAAKLYLMLALVQNGGWCWVLTAVVAFNTVISAFYYFRILRAMYFTDDGRPVFSVHPLGLAVCVCSAIMLLAMLIGYNPLSKVTAGFSRISGVEGAAAR